MLGIKTLGTQVLGTSKLVPHGWYSTCYQVLGSFLLVPRTFVPRPCYPRTWYPTTWYHAFCTQKWGPNLFPGTSLRPDDWWACLALWVALKHLAFWTNLPGLIYIYIYIYTYIYICISIFVYTPYAHMIYICMCICRTCVCMYVYIYIAYGNTHIYIHIYKGIYASHSMV